jgi:hypothetical protein
MLVYFVAIWSLLLPFGVFSGNLINLIVIWLIFSRFGMLDREKSGNPEQDEN